WRTKPRKASSRHRRANGLKSWTLTGRRPPRSFALARSRREPDLAGYSEEPLQRAADERPGVFDEVLRDVYAGRRDEVAGHVTFLMRDDRQRNRVQGDPVVRRRRSLDCD